MWDIVRYARRGCLYRFVGESYDVCGRGGQGLVYLTVFFVDVVLFSTACLK